MPYFDLARTEYHRRLGHLEFHGALAMRALAVEYLAPARFDDLLEVFVRVDKLGRTSVTYDYAVYRLDEDGSDLLMATARQTSVLIDLDARRPIPIPDTFREQIASFER